MNEERQDVHDSQTRARYFWHHTTPPFDFPDILAVIDGMLVVETDDDGVGQTTLYGLRYLLSVEFSRQQPALSLIYDIEFQVLGVKQGSKHYDFKALVRLKRRIRAQLRKVDKIALLTLLLAVPPAIIATDDIYTRLFTPVEKRLSADMPHVQINIIYSIRQPDGRDVLSKSAQNFDF